MPKLIAGTPEVKDDLYISVSQDAKFVDIKVNGVTVAFFEEQDGKIVLELVSGLDEVPGLEVLKTEDGYLVANANQLKPNKENSKWQS